MSKLNKFFIMLIFFLFCILFIGCGHEHQYISNVVAPTCTSEGYTEHYCECGEKYMDNIVNKLEHMFDEWIIVLEPTDETQGIESRKCTLCEYMEYQDIEKLSHTHTYVESKVESTCSKKGYIEYTCKCGDSYKEELEKIAHIEVIDKGIEATCTKSGLTEGKHCSVCNEVLVAQKEIPALPHTEVVDPGVAATCTSTGFTEGKHCSVCNEVLVKQSVIPMLNHKEVVDKGYAATCTESGLTDGKHCSVCNKVIIAQKTIAALGHKEVVDVAINPTCTATGLTEGKHCSACNTVFVSQEIIALIPHTEVVDSAISPTCTTTGLTEGKHCGVCNGVLVAQKVVEALGHTEAITEGKAATCIETGLTDKKYCSVCDETLEDHVEIPAIGHTEVVDDKVNPTCTATGLTEGKHCSVCDEVLVAQEIIAALGHTEVADVKVEPTCTETGLTEGKHCSVCDEVLVAQELIAALGHSEVVDTKIEATCTETGLTEGKHCSVCDEVLVSQEIVASLGHSYGDWAVQTPATESTTGLEIKECDKCFDTIENTFTIYDTYFEYILVDNSYYKISSFNNSIFTSDTIVISSSYRGLPITALESNLFSGCSGLVNITIPATITNINDNAFGDCSGLVNVYYDGTLDEWCKIEFDTCTANPMYCATSFNLLNENKQYEELINLFISSSITKVNSNAFYGFDNLESIMIPANVITIGENAFSKLSENIVINCVTNEKLEGWHENWTDCPTENIYWGYLEGTVLGKVSIGNSTYKTLHEALLASKPNDVLVLHAGTYNEEYIIANSGITITMNSDDVDEITITGKFVISKDVKNVIFDTLNFSGSGQISTDSAGGQENITVNNCIFDNSVIDGAQGIVYFAGPVKNVVFTNNQILNCNAPRTIRASKTVDGLVVSNNYFENGGESYDWIRVDSVISGDVTINNNIVKGSDQSFIMFMYHGSGNFTIRDNEIYDMAKVAIDIRTTNGVACTSTFNIIHNILDNSNVSVSNIWNPIRLRFNNYTKETLDANINYNIYINWGTTFLQDASGCGLGWVNMDNNYFDGATSDEISSTNFQNIASSWTNIFTTIEDLEKEYEVFNIDNDDNALLVGESSEYNKEKYSTLAEALEAAVEGNVIYLLPGSHTGNVNVTKNNITITSLNRLFDPNSDSVRKEEATFDSVIALAKGLKNVTISGIKFIGNAQILNELGDAGTSSTHTTNLNGFTFTNNIIESGLTSGNGFIYTVEAARSYSHNINISNNLFTTTNGFAALSMLYIDNNYNITLESNIFRNITASNVVYFKDTTKGLSGQYSKLNSNSFENITGNALWINWLSPLPEGSTTAIVSIQDNEFENVLGTAIYVGSMNNTDSYAAINVKFNEFTKVNTAINFSRVHSKINLNCNYNIFNDIPSEYYIVNQKTALTNIILNARDNLFLNGNAKVNPDASKFSGVDMIDYSTTLDSIYDMPSYDSKANAIEIVCPDLFVGDEYQVEINYYPSSIKYAGVTWKVSDESIATIDENGLITCLKAGTVIITATYVYDKDVTSTYELTIFETREISFEYENDGTLLVGDELQINASIVGDNATGTIIWSSSNNEIATVVDGKVIALKPGTVKIMANIEGSDVYTSCAITVLDSSELNDLLQLLINGNNSTVWNRTINYIGYETGYEKSPNQVYSSVNSYWAGTLPATTLRMLTSSNPNYSGRTMKSIEFITVHDTGSASPSANGLQNAKWCTNTSNTSSSWHYTIGNDGIYKHLEDNEIAYHAGDGGSWATSTTLYNTGIVADSDLRNRPTITLNADGYFYLNGQKTLVKMPSGATVSTGTNTLGIAAVVKDGYYYIPSTWVTSSYGKVVAIRGGNLNSIGIETAVNTGSDVYLTWQITAKFIAQLLITNNLTPERVLFHNNFANKTCPNTMINSDNVEMFLDMVYIEYYVAKNYSDYTITFTSNNPDVIDSEGRVVGSGPTKDTNVSYTITVSDGTKSKSATLYSVVQGA